MNAATAFQQNHETLSLRDGHTCVHETVLKPEYNFHLVHFTLQASKLTTQGVKMSRGMARERSQ